MAPAFCWQGRAGEALKRQQEARSWYRQAAYYPAAYYGPGRMRKAWMKLCCVFATWRGSYILAFVTYNGDPRRAKE